MIFVDAIVVKVRDGQVRNTPFYVVMGVTVNGERDILGIWSGDGAEGARFWLQVFTELKNRGVEDVLIAVCDGLKGLPEAINTTWEQTVVQTLSLHNGGVRGFRTDTCVVAVRTYETSHLRGPHADPFGRRGAESCISQREQRHRPGDRRDKVLTRGCRASSVTGWILLIAEGTAEWLVFITNLTHPMYSPASTGVAPTTNYVWSTRTARCWCNAVFLTRSRASRNSSDS